MGPARRGVTGRDGRAPPAAFRATPGRAGKGPPESDQPCESAGEPVKVVRQDGPLAPSKRTEWKKSRNGV
ncbi:hypothetical protein GCM10027187_16120 [Streptosporangium sandarakinum]